ncbi:tetratricopeptide repeat-containing sensor histidine kinase [Siansivirga zeaxanthinifaciens]|uniref:Histidine kinase n=1 Tax=Siansivirga zeaxanthinifaciens CC-SAMT-1 TaxID=1454006 RepID=A0A0C5W639_9FLAO|nr:sensor histidine kinase [Siansivirga zeaxanthinifaciens]AJR02603.1 histidine kinase [Siansivirga zeaxanthinifaciens CC-SAMT-1]
MNLRVLIITALLLGFHLSWSQDNVKAKLDSFEVYIKRAKNKTEFDYNKRFAYANKAKYLAQNLKLDTLIVKSNIVVSEMHLERGLNNLFLKTSKDNLRFSEKLKDSVSIAEINQKLGDYFYNIQLTDSAYFYYHNSEKIYRSLNDDFNTATLLLYIAIIQKNEKDYTGSEITSTEGIKFLEGLKKTDAVVKKKAYLFNNLGNIFDQLEQYEESIKYHKKALELKKTLDGNNKLSIDVSTNNLALAYKNSGNYQLALSHYKQLLADSNLKTDHPNMYALVLDNYAHTMYLSGNSEQLPDLYLEALNVSNSVENKGYNSIIINQHLAEYYNDIGNKDSAKLYAYAAKEISEKYHNDDLLKSLLLLSKIEQGEAAANHLRAYVKLNDSLQKNERNIRNKFARIRFETNQLEEENVQIAKERLWLLIISVVLIVSSFLLYLVITQRNRNKELQFIQQQQKTNEEIYNLMLSQNEKIEEARTNEKKRISQELHDGVLGRLFGTRLSLDSLNMNTSPEAIKTRSEYIDGLKTIEQDIRKVSHELNTDFVSGSGFIDIIRTLVESQTIAYKLNYKLEYEDVINWDDISNKTKIHIYRIIQETLHNIYKHAKATHVNISFKLNKNVICLTIHDNGSGFDVNKIKSGIGLKNMKSRMKEIKGEIKISSTINEGTTVEIEAPIKLT